MHADVESRHYCEVRVTNSLGVFVGVGCNFGLLAFGEGRVVDFPHW